MRCYLENPEAREESRLNVREEEVAKLVAEAHTTEQIAGLLVSDGLVEP